MRRATRILLINSTIIAGLGCIATLLWGLAGALWALALVLAVSLVYAHR